ncbi:hypothetical protein WMF37_42525 [Sorangium sp. So ce291]|uniref:hypothetical protein n=1 Tax=Sorangium sp. So ce291 TaxID=3133294 RepID=UPI003F640AC1
MAKLPMARASAARVRPEPPPLPPPSPPAFVLAPLLSSLPPPLPLGSLLLSPHATSVDRAIIDTIQPVRILRFIAISYSMFL